MSKLQQQSYTQALQRLVEQQPEDEEVVTLHELLRAHQQADTELVAQDGSDEQKFAPRIRSPLTNARAALTNLLYWILDRIDPHAQELHGQEEEAPQKSMSHEPKKKILSYVMKPKKGSAPLDQEALLEALQLLEEQTGRISDDYIKTLARDHGTSAIAVRRELFADALEAALEEASRHFQRHHLPDFTQMDAAQTKEWHVQREDNYKLDGRNISRGSVQHWVFRDIFVEQELPLRVAALSLTIPHPSIEGLKLHWQPVVVYGGITKNEPYETLGLEEWYKVLQTVGVTVDRLTRESLDIVVFGGIEEKAQLNLIRRLSSDNEGAWKNLSVSVLFDETRPYVHGEGASVTVNPWKGDAVILSDELRASLSFDVSYPERDLGFATLAESEDFIKKNGTPEAKGRLNADTGLFHG
ncbi:MAG: hypothetical protein J0L97_06690 [Alphaproteobacteria bacterium]|nr:hypothetical protein [Alphaproteobacteria bacterium]